MMNVAQKASFELIPIDAPANGFADAHTLAALLAKAINSISGLDRSRLLIFGGWESAARGAGVTMQLLGEELGIVEQFQGVDQLTVRSDGSFEILERIEGGRHMVSICEGPPALLGWATGNLPEPKNNPQVGMANMRSIMPALQKAKPESLANDAVRYLSVTPPKQQRQTRIAKDISPEQIAAELVEWISQE
jgi:electron transfer flavoprotein beta subunit